LHLVEHSAGEENLFLFYFLDAGVEDNFIQLCRARSNTTRAVCGYH
jgi:hypothetical protein